MQQNLFALTETCLQQAQVAEKCACVRQLRQSWLGGRLPIAAAPLQPIGEVGRPTKPTLVAPRYLPHRSLHSPQGHAALVHAICHIEFNAINLALDAVYRFRDMPSDYYGDWLRVAEEEAEHFSLLSDHLHTLGHAYGDFDAHNGLWEMACDTAHDVLVRMALVPRVLEARGLDVTPAIMDKFIAIDDHAAVQILKIIQRDEVGHVKVGTRWFRYLCQQRQLDAESTFRQLFAQYMKGNIKGPLDREARLRAGFSQSELDYLEGAG